MEPPTLFGPWLKQRRKALDLTQAELAAVVGCATMTVQKIEAEERRPSKTLAVHLARALAVPPADHATFVRIARGELSAERLSEHTESLTAAPSRAAHAWRPTVPLPRTPLIGREQERAQLRALVMRDDVGLVTLGGVGGVGKTRLALQVAADLTDAFSDGVVFVALEAVVDPALVPATIARVLDVPERNETALLDSLCFVLRERELLLVLDNFEQVLAAAPAVATLLRAAPRLTVLVTSRAPLRLQAEHIFPLPPLAIPDPRHLPEVAVLAQVAAVALFLRRAQAVAPAFHLTDWNAPAVAEICARLDGLPLAIELAAARSTLFPPQALLARLENRLHVLTDGARDLPARQQTLRAAIDWSYALLQNDEQMLFRRLAVFAGGWTVAAVEAVTASDDSPPRDVLDRLHSLLDHSLIQRMGSADVELRFTMLETIREYAVACLEVSGERERVEQHHAASFLALAEAAATALEGPQQLAWLARLEVEHDNLRAVLAWSTRERDGSAVLRRATGLRLADALTAFWERRGHLTEGRAWLDRLLSQAEWDGATGTAPAANLVATAVTAAARLAYMHGDLPAARRLYERSRAWHTEQQEPRGRAVALVGLGHIAAAYDDLPGARTYYQDALALRRELDDIRGVSSVSFSLGHIAMALGDLDEAVARMAEATALDHAMGDTAGLALNYDAAGQLAFLQGRYDEANGQTEAALALYRELGDTVKVAETLDTLGWLAVQHGEYRRAASLLIEAIARAREVDGNQAVLAWPLCRLGIVATRQRDTVRACGLLAESLALFMACEPPETAGISLCLLGVASVASEQQAPEQSARLVGAAAVLHEAGNMWCRGFAQREIEHVMTVARARLDEKAWAAAWAEGQAMTVEQAMDEALAITR